LLVGEDFVKYKIFFNNKDSITKTNQFQQILNKKTIFNHTQSRNVYLS